MNKNWRIVHPDDYFHHPYSETWLSEREIEIEIARRWLDFNSQDLIEVGAVMPYYAEIKHEVIDPYDPKATIADFMENHDLTMMKVLSISTIEHIGTTDYVELERQNVVDEKAAIQALTKLLDECDECLVSIPIGYNPHLDKWLEANLGKLNCFGYEKVIWFPTEDGVKSLWNYYDSVSTIKGRAYNKPFPLGNFVLFIEGWK
jgi:hypothetical protein